MKSVKTIKGFGYVDPTFAEAERRLEEERYVEQIAKKQKRHSGVLRMDETPAKSFSDYIDRAEARQDCVARLHYLGRNIDMPEIMTDEWFGSQYGVSVNEATEEQLNNACDELIKERKALGIR